MAVMSKLAGFAWVESRKPLSTPVGSGGGSPQESEVQSECGFLPWAQHAEGLRPMGQ